MITPLTRMLTRHASISIIGMCKNAGKTTVLNRLIGLLAKDESRTPALTSIGRDGETVDIVTGTEKPGIWVHAGTLLATAADTLRLSDITREILSTTGMRTPMGEVVLLRALSGGFVQLAGPSTAEQLARLSGMLRASGADIVLIDGALSRKSLGAPAVSEAVILCAGASYHPDLDRVVRDTAYACALLSLPISSGAHARRHLLAGALTPSAAARLAPRDGDEITVVDASRILLSQGEYAKLAARGIRVTVENAVTLGCVCVNPYSATGPGFDPAVFFRRMAAAVSVPVVNVSAEE